MQQAIRETCLAARAASRRLAPASRSQKDAALERMSAALLADAAEILSANAADVAAARTAGTSAALLDRLTLDPRRLEAVAAAVREVAALPDPVGQIIAEYTRPNGLRVRRVRVPIGVIAMIYEARPNVTVEAASLCLKSGNAVVLRGGSDAARTNAALLATVARRPRDSASIRCCRHAACC